MRGLRFWAIAGLALAALAGGASSARAASSYDNCVGYIDAPSFIPKPGTWCLRQNLVTSITSGAAIEINADHVTIDCNGFVLDNSPGGPRTGATGVASYGYSGITVRNCAIQGFANGISVIGGTSANGGHVIENNRVRQSRVNGISVEGYGSVIRDNIVANTGGGPGVSAALGIFASGRVDVVDNVIDGVFGDNSLADFQTFGIYYAESGSVNAGCRCKNRAQSGEKSHPEGQLSERGHRGRGPRDIGARQPDRARQRDRWRWAVMFWRCAGPRQHHQELRAGHARRLQR